MKWNARYGVLLYHQTSLVEPILFVVKGSFVFNAPVIWGVMLRWWHILAITFCDIELRCKLDPIVASHSSYADVRNAVCRIISALVWLKILKTYFNLVVWIKIRKKHSEGAGISRQTPCVDFWFLNLFKYYIYQHFICTNYNFLISLKHINKNRCLHSRLQYGTYTQTKLHTDWTSRHFLSNMGPKLF